MEQFQSTWAPLLYLLSGILFILALRGLSSPATSRKGNRNGMIGMAIAVGTTLALVWDNLDATTWGLILGGVAVGGTIGAVIARRIPMTAMPQLVAAFHSLVGMAAVLVAAAAGFSFFLYMASMRWVTRKPPNMLIEASTTARSPVPCANRLPSPVAAAPAASSAPTMITEEIALVTLIRGVWRAGVTDHTT